MRCHVLYLIWMPLSAVQLHGPQKSNTFCDLAAGLKVDLMLCACVCTCVFVTDRVSMPFRKAGHRAMDLQLPLLCTLFDRADDSVYSHTCAHIHIYRNTKACSILSPQRYLMITLRDPLCAQGGIVCRFVSGNVL